MRHNPQQVAWVIISTAFCIFWLIAASVCGLGYWYLFIDTYPSLTGLTSVRGIVLISSPSSELPNSVTDGQNTPVEEAQTIATDDTSQAILTFIEESSVTMYGNSQLTLLETQQPRFWFTQSKPRITLKLDSGRIRVTTARSQQDVPFRVLTPHGMVICDQGSYSIEVDEAKTQVVVRLGQADLVAQGQTTTIPENRRGVIVTDGRPSPPLPSARNLLGSSNFSPIFTETWQIDNRSLSPAVTNTVRVTSFGNRTVLELQSHGEDFTHTDVGVTKLVDQDVRDYRSLRVFAEVRLFQQSLEGGGYQGSEFPIMLDVTYHDETGTERHWVHGFYYLRPPDNYILYDQPNNDSDRIAPLIWYPFESKNLLAILGDQKPVYIKSIRIYASGWLYHSMVANISLLAEE